MYVLLIAVILKTPTNYIAPDETLDITQLPLRCDSSSLSSTAACELHACFYFADFNRRDLFQWMNDC